ncbi:hypothetical protein V6N13_131320 [Hibiscus sabdariffa]|uniref:Uncharacterized protein n=1 Tax=Hibiscus sabdariffa TaxID=183260 RepID=A0ABR2D7I8_9ROSI
MSTFSGECFLNLNLGFLELSSSPISIEQEEERYSSCFNPLCLIINKISEFGSSFQASKMAKGRRQSCSWLEVAPAPIIYPEKPSTSPGLETIFEDVAEEYDDIA